MHTAQEPQRREDAFDPDSDLALFAAQHLGETPTGISEIGNGNLNHVYRVTGSTGSIIVKQAVPYVRRVGASWPLTIRRLEIEARAYEVHAQVAPHALPRLFGHDRSLHVLALEDLRDSVDWRTLLTADVDIPDAASLAGEYCGRVAAGTGVLALTAGEATRLRKAFGDPAMQMFTDEMVFVAPYHDHPTNAWPAHLEDAAQIIRADEVALRAAHRARWLFRTSGECLLHGDLHSGSVMTGLGQSSHVIDLEFAFVGPIAFDLGNLVAHLLLARSRRMVRRTEVTVIDAAAFAFWESMIDALRSGLAASNGWTVAFEKKLLVETALFAGTEIFRRVVGRFHVGDLESLALSEREEAERHCINSWRRLIEAADLRTFGELWELATTNGKDYL